MKIFGRITEHKPLTVSNYKVNSGKVVIVKKTNGPLLLSETFVTRADKSDALKRIEIRQREIAGEKLPDNVKQIAHASKR